MSALTSDRLGKKGEKKVGSASDQSWNKAERTDSTKHPIIISREQHVLYLTLISWVMHKEIILSQNCAESAGAIRLHISALQEIKIR